MIFELELKGSKNFFKEETASQVFKIFFTPTRQH
jgi:hypothetical protein